MIDNFGTIVLCTHEQLGKKPIVVFWPNDNESVTCPISEITYDNEHDVMFGSIDPDLLKGHDVRPANLATIGYQDGAKGEEIIAVGWPSPSGRLHAVAGKIRSFEPKIALPNKLHFDCKNEADLVSFPGMSGGGVFYKGSLVGIANTATDPGIEAFTCITATDFLVVAYQNLFPNRAAAEGLHIIEEKNTPDVCQFNRRQFLSRSFSPR